ncbi:MAG: glycosyltransferase family 2 protein [Candidatus Margulisiibacteriota bacterium]|jgi:glycosyltransferase involved in cell wall biosynthesis
MQQNKNYLPLITVISVVYNDEANLETTIKSVLAQTYPNIEYIIIDGGSTDNTLGIIKKYEDKIAYWVSEKDAGIYDAMNKGVQASTGAWVNFMNSQDVFFEPSTILDIFSKDHANYDVLYGNVGIKYPNGFSRIAKPRDFADLWQGMICSHQAIFARTELLKEYPFDLNYKLAADFDLIYKLKQRNKRFLYFDQVIAIISSGGVSDDDRVRAVKEYYQIVCKYPVKIFWRIYYKLMIVYTYFKLRGKKNLPKGLIEIFLKFKWG